ncbi:MAG: YdcF family protein [Planctomycetota bacterium]
MNSASQTPAATSSCARVVHGFFRTAGAALAAFAILNAAGDLVTNRFGVDFLWIRFPSALAAPGRAALLGAAGALLWAAVRPFRTRRAAIACEALLAAIALTALWNTLGFWRLVIAGDVHTWLPVPSSLVVVIVMAANGRRIWREHVGGERIDSCDGPGRLAAVHGASFVLVALAGPLLLLVAYGATDYSPMVGGRRAPADCIVVYGARVYADGTPSLALADRVSAGVRLWREGRGRYLVMSGAVDPRDVSEPGAMKRIALDAGVPADAIVLDPTGANTWRSAVGASRLLARWKWRSSISVSHYFHLLRIQMSARRAGLVSYTSPAPMTRRLVREPYFVLRECAAFYGYYFFRWGSGAADEAHGPDETVASRP